MNIWEKIQRVLEYDHPAVGIGVPDDSGMRKGLYRPLIKRASDFPYDRDDQYGEPQPYDRGSGGRGAMHQPLTPKNTAHSIWDEMEEAMGTPMFLSKAYDSQLGSSVPGSGNQWGDRPINPWDEDEMDDKKLTRASHEEVPYPTQPDGLEVEGGPLNIDTSPPDVEEIPNSMADYPHDQTDDELEKKIDRLWGRYDGTDPLFKPGDKADSDIFVVKSDPTFKTGIGGSFKLSRGSQAYGLIPKESIWIKIEGFLK